MTDTRYVDENVKKVEFVISDSQTISCCWCDVLCAVLTGFERNNKYEIKNGLEQKVYSAAESQFTLQPSYSIYFLFYSYSGRETQETKPDTQ